MSSRSENLKDLNKNSIRLVILAMGLVVFLIQLGVDGYVNIKNVYIGLGVSGIGAVISLLLVNIVPQNLKHILVFWRITRVLPGNRVVELCKKDERLNIDDLQKKWPDLFLDYMPEQKRNSFWYKNIYKKTEFSIQVLDAHKYFLLFRDLCSATLVMFLCTAILKITEIDGLYIKTETLALLFFSHLFFH